MSKNNKISKVENLFLALADKTRLRLLNLMRSEEVCVYLFTEILGESQPKISRHLAYLRNAGVAEARRDGKQMLYRIVKPEDKFAARILNDVLDWLENQNEMQKEFDRLNQTNDSADNLTNPIQEGNIYAQADKYKVREELEVFLL